MTLNETGEALDREIAALKAEVEVMKGVVIRGVSKWTPGTPVSSKVNSAFRRVLEIGSRLHECNDALVHSGTRRFELTWRVTRQARGGPTEYYAVLPSGGTALIRLVDGVWIATLQWRGMPDQSTKFASALDAQMAIQAQDRQRLVSLGLLGASR